jgi:hypothetical protein
VLEFAKGFANWADLATQPNPQVSPLMTRGQEYRANRRSP